MKFCLLISGNYYVFALFFFALIIQVLLLPLAIKQQKSQVLMAKMKPKEMAIRGKYAGRTDKATQQKMSMEIQEMYREEGYSAFSGCLPLLIQLPIIFILFAVVRSPITYSSTSELANNVQPLCKQAIEILEEEKQALLPEKFETKEEYDNALKNLQQLQKNIGGKAVEENGDLLVKYEFDKGTFDTAVNYELYLAQLMLYQDEQIEELKEAGYLPQDFTISNPFEERFKEDLPKFDVFGMNLLQNPSFSGNYILLLVPLFVFLSSFFAGKVSRKYSVQTTDANGKTVGGGIFMEWGMPLLSMVFCFQFSAAIYWIWRTLIGMVQPVVLSRFYPIPKVTEEEIAAAKKAIKQKQKKKKVIMIEVDEDDDSYRDIEVQSSAPAAKDGDYRKPKKVEMLSSEDDASAKTQAPASEKDKQANTKEDDEEAPH